MLPQQFADMLEQVMNTILYPARWFKTILDYTHMRMIWWGAIFGIMLITLVVAPLIAGHGSSDKVKDPLTISKPSYRITRREMSWKVRTYPSGYVKGNGQHKQLTDGK